MPPVWRDYSASALNPPARKFGVNLELGKENGTSVSRSAVGVTKRCPCGLHAAMRLSFVCQHEPAARGVKVNPATGKYDVNPEGGIRKGMGKRKT